MLDLLLQRGDDLALWQDADIAYVVVDEFHTYDGAQGTDVAMLLRRLAAATNHSQPGKPLGKICPVATSATLGEGGNEERIREVAEQVFGIEFGENSVITEQRLPTEEFLGEIDYSLPLPAPQELAVLGDPRVDDQAMAEIAKLVTGQEITDPAELGRVLRTHILTHALMDVLGDRPSTAGEVLDLLPRKGAYNWGEAFRRFPRADGGRAGAVRRAAFRGPEPGRRDPAVPAHRDAPVDPAAQPAAPGHQPEPEVRLVRGAEPGDGDHRRAGSPASRCPPCTAVTAAVPDGRCFPRRRTRSSWCRTRRRSTARRCPASAWSGR